MLIWVFGKTLVVYAAFGGVYVHNLHFGHFTKIDYTGACISLDARDGRYEHSNHRCEDLAEDEVWSHVLACTSTECKLW